LAESGACGNDSQEWLSLTLYVLQNTDGLDCTSEFVLVAVIVIEFPRSLRNPFLQTLAGLDRLLVKENGKN
jgi:hypothetical protein